MKTVMPSDPAGPSPEVEGTGTAGVMTAVKSHSIGAPTWKAVSDPALPATSGELPPVTAIYIRVRSEVSCGEEAILRQAEACERHIARSGSCLYVDRSGADCRNRPGLLTMLDAARAGSIDRIVVEDLDRVSRDQKELWRIVSELKSLAIHIEIANVGRVELDDLIHGALMRVRHRVHRRARSR